MNKIKKILANGALITFVVILLIEHGASPFLFSRFVSHEVDWTIRNLHFSTFSQPVVVLGDSVGHRVFSGWNTFHSDIVNLACNQATETAGQYFFLMRFLKKNKKPGAVIICDRTPLNGNLDQNLIENYIQRVFTNWSEIFELLVVKKDPVFSAKMISYKLLSSLKYRLHLQEEIAGFTNSNKYTGLGPGESGASSQYSLVRNLSHFKNSFREESISHHFFRKILIETAKRNIKVFYLPPPTQIGNRDTHQMVLSSMNKLKDLEREFENFQILEQYYKRYPKRYFGDGVHPNPEGLRIYWPAMEQEVKHIVKDASRRLIADNVKVFKGGEIIFNYNNSSAFQNFEFLNAVFSPTTNDTMVLNSLGIDPAILLPKAVSIDKKVENHLVVMVRVESSVNSIARLYFRPSENQKFSEEQKVSLPIHHGRNNLFFTLPVEFSEGLLRFDPGEMKGKFKITQIEGSVLSPERLDRLEIVQR